ncbi:Gfo/Idh/MocA family protein [Paenibacillus spongiae]|uniref:Gfo/Idh/MocA family oxidoreductase n=1 Tax=Paenibacillus spongiae TaxID=2909671 RepID=A0ABY5SAG0_9BACL|nr:Gfo/Idh/MocA family oxidoreductase [Paenibacillus spongiae]UVI30724.1 Gfo/Idh/MocA family oxidoreductase [Paenibacillus spongiae]
MDSIKIGMIGLDTSHVTAFTKLINDVNHEHHVPGGRVTAAYPGGSPDFPLSINRVEGFTEELRNQYGVEIVATPEEVAERCDAILLESADGRVHLEQFRRIASYGKPVFIDKPLALKAADAEEIGRIAAKHGIPVMSASSLRYTDALIAELEREGAGMITGADVHGPMPVEPTQSYYFWYGIHTAEMLFAIMGTGCEEVYASSSESHELITGRWRDGRIGTIRGSRDGSYQFGALVHRTKGSAYINASAAARPAYAGLMEQVIAMFKTGRPSLNWEETIAIIRFLEKAEESRTSGAAVRIHP